MKCDIKIPLLSLFKWSVHAIPVTMPDQQQLKRKSKIVEKWMIKNTEHLTKIIQAEFT